MQLFLTIALCLMIGAATAYFANQRGRDPLIWFMVGMLLGIFGLLLLFLLPPVAEEVALNTAPEDVSGVQGEPPARSYTHDYLVKDWFYYDGQRQRQGPIRFEKLKELWKESAINEGSYVWTEGMNEWQKIEEIHNLYTHLQLG